METDTLRRHAGATSRRSSRRSSDAIDLRVSGTVDDVRAQRAVRQPATDFTITRDAVGTLTRDCTQPRRTASAAAAPDAARQPLVSRRRGAASAPARPPSTLHAVSTEWAGRRLHFVGIGGAGMSGLALVAHALGATVTGSDRARRLALRRRRCARVGIEPAAGHDAANVPDGAEVVVSSRDPAGEPGARRGARARPARAAPRRAAGRADAAAPDDRRHRHARQDDDVEHARARAARLRHGPGATSSAARCARPAPTPAGARGSGSSSRPTSPTARCSAGARRSRCSRTPSSTTTRPTPRSATSTRRSARSSRSRDRAAVVWDRPELLALAPAGDARWSRSTPTPELTAGRLALRARRRHGRAERPGRPQRAQRRRGADRRAARRRRPRGRRRRAARLPGRRPALRAARHDGAGGASSSTTTRTIPTEVAATLEAARTLAPRRVIAVFQPHLYSRTARQAAEFGAALAAADEVVVLDVYPARERRRGLPRRHRAAGRRGGGRRRRRPRRSRGCRRSSRPRRCCAGRLRDGDLVLTLGAGDVDALGRALVAEVGSSRARAANWAIMARSHRLPWRVLAGVLLAVGRARARLALVPRLVVRRRRARHDHRQRLVRARRRCAPALEAAARQG